MFNLTLLRCYGNQLNALDVLNNHQLKDLMCANNLLTEIDISNNPGLVTFTCGYNQFTSLYLANNVLLTSIEISGMPTLTDVCVWELPFPPDGVTVDTMYSSNIVFSKSCISYMAEKRVDPNEFSVYPVPAYDLIYINIKRATDYSIEIKDILGKTVYSDKNYYDNKEIYVGSLNKGVYFVNAKTGSYNITQKFFIQ